MKTGKTKSSKRIATFLLAFVMLLSLMPSYSASAVGPETASHNRAGATMVLAPDDDRSISTEGEGEAASADGESEAAPADGESEAAPTDGESGAAPTDGESGAAPTDGESGAAPADGESEAAPTDGESEAAPTDGESEAAPADGEGEAAPADGEGGEPQSGENGESQSGEKRDSQAEDEEPAVSFVEREGVSALLLGNQAAENMDAADAELRDNTDLSEEEIVQIMELFFENGDGDTDETEAETAEDEAELPRQGDGSNIESIDARWITVDTVDNGDPAFLYFKPSGNDPFSVRLQINYALSGEHNYDPGDITITVPAYVFTNRSGDPAGTMIIPYPEDPSTKSDFNYKLVGDYYILTNTRRMSAATKGYIQFAFDQLVSHELVDMEVSDVFDAYIQVVTHKEIVYTITEDERPCPPGSGVAQRGCGISFWRGENFRN